MNCEWRQNLKSDCKHSILEAGTLNHCDLIIKTYPAVWAFCTFSVIFFLILGWKGQVVSFSNMPIWYHTDPSEDQSCCCLSWKKLSSYKSCNPSFRELWKLQRKAAPATARFCHDHPCKPHIMYAKKREIACFMRGIMLQIFRTSLQFCVQWCFKSLL